MSEAQARERLSGGPRPRAAIYPSISKLYGRRWGSVAAFGGKECTDSALNPVRLYRRSNGVLHYDFPQVVLLYPGVQMNWTPRLSREVETLAANILVWFLPKRGPYAYLCPNCLMGQEHRSEGLAWQFAKQILVTMPFEGSELEGPFLNAWVDAHLAILHGHRCRDLGRSCKGRLRGLPRGAWMKPAEVVD
jgi:hypothetical protein